MSNTFFISDTHWGHSNILTFTTGAECSPVRPGFADVQEMDEHMVKCWNSVVRPQDKVYHLGDICIHKRNLPILNRCNGEKVLIRGNHDLEKASVYLQYFKDVRGSHQIDKLLLTHIPIHPQSLARWRANIHGHLHTHQVMSSPHHPDPRYMCVSVEQINYTPISLDEVNKLLGK
jgi:calcineurin-like phosphoesterase family protein